MVTTKLPYKANPVSLVGGTVSYFLMPFSGTTVHYKKGKQGKNGKKGKKGTPA